MELSNIYKSIEGDLAKVKMELTSISNIEFKWLSEQLTYVIKGGGKGIRPALTLLSSKFYDYNLTYLLPMAVAVELMHTSTLIHDDAIDKSTVRRGRPTFNKLWGVDPAVLLGDYLFAKAGEFVADTQNLRVIKLFSQTLAIISSGEVSQFLSTFELEQDREHYIRRIAQKTASLFSLATESGAVLSKAPEESIVLLKAYGYNLGIAFQIVDDILDFTGTEQELGKPVGSDLTQGTLTLPAMLLMERYPVDNPVRKSFESKGQDKQKYIKETIDLIHNSSIVKECNEVAAEYCAKACLTLDKLPDSPSRQALMNLASFVSQRER